MTELCAREPQEHGPAARAADPAHDFPHGRAVRVDDVRGWHAAHPPDDLGHLVGRQGIDEDDRRVAGYGRAHILDRRDLALVGGLVREAHRDEPDAERAAVPVGEPEGGDGGGQEPRTEKCGPNPLCTPLRIEMPRSGEYRPEIRPVRQTILFRLKE